MIIETSLKEKLINQIVNQLRKFGFINVSKDNILSDEVYSLYFSKILNEKIGENQELDLVIKQLLSALPLKNKTA